MSIIHNIVKRAVFLHQIKRPLFYWTSIQFNAVDEERRKLLGPDRTCAEWILRNGGTLKWADSPDLIVDYNELPKEGTILRVQEIDATGTSVMHNGFAHFKGCNHINKINFHKCNSLENNALGELHYLKESLKSLEVSSCPNISEEGLLHLKVLTNLKELVVYDLHSVKNLNNVIVALKNSLPQCNVKKAD